MNELTKLTEKISAEAEAYRENVEKTTRQECEKITGSFREEADREGRAIIEAARAQAEAIHRRAESQAGIEGRGLKLSARREMIGKAFELASAKLAALPDDKLLAFFTRMALQAQTTDAVLIWGKTAAHLAPRVVEEVNRQNALKGIRLELAPAAGGFEGGFILKQGPIETNCTFPVLLKAVSEELEAPVAKILFD